MEFFDCILRRDGCDLACSIKVCSDYVFVKTESESKLYMYNPEELIVLHQGKYTEFHDIQNNIQVLINVSNIPQAESMELTIMLQGEQAYQGL